MTQLANQRGATDVDGLPASGLYIPEGDGVFPAGVDLGADAQGNHNAAALGVPILPNLIGQSKSLATGDTSDAAVLPAQGANTLCYLCGVLVSLSGIPASSAAFTITITGIAFSLIYQYVVLSGNNSGSPNNVQFSLPLPASAANGAITVTLTKAGGGALGISGTLTAWGFYRAV